MSNSGGSWRDGDKFGNGILKYDILFTKFRDNEIPYSSVDATRSLIALNNYMNREKLTKEDIVIWNRVAFMHLPRSEDWPAQPIVWHGFVLLPRDFLDASPLEVTK